jgi:hypothetical protein
MTDALWVSIEGNTYPSGSTKGVADSADGATFARKRAETPMQTDCPRQQRKLPQPLRSMIESVARLFLGEPASIVPRRKMDRLAQLERREQLQLAERRGDDTFLDRELAENQLTEADLKRMASSNTPLADWPDEDFENGFVEDNENCGTGI